MTCTVVVGTQWGDEGKGKIVDLLTQRVDAVVRYQGGNNAGHTVMFADQEFILHSLPSGILRNTLSILGNGVVIDLQALLAEIQTLKRSGLSLDHLLKISDHAHVVMPWHHLFDQLREAQRSKAQQIGTTQKGIGPTYCDKTERIGIRLSDFKNLETFQQKLSKIIPEKNYLLKHYFQADVTPFDLENIVQEYQTLFARLQEYLVDSVALIHNLLAQNKQILFEGAQGTFLDLDHGTYPFVTSSNTVAGNACVGSGIGPTQIKTVLGIAKAYTTRVGGGPFPTELCDETGEFLQKAGNEFGATTGRQRRCGWFDAVLVKQAVRLNGITHLVLTKLDILDHLEILKIATHYCLKSGEVIDCYPSCSLDEVEEVIYEERQGWQSRTAGLTEYAKLPVEMIAYIQRISELVKVPLAILSTGPRREETIFLDQSFF